MAERPGKRTDPKKLMKDRAAIQKDFESRTGPSPFESFMDAFDARVKARKRRRAGFGPEPSKKGASVYGTKDMNKDA